VWKNLKEGDNPLDKIPIMTRQEIESMLEKQFKEKKDNNYDYFSENCKFCNA
jgi:hypothetical protein